MPIPLIDIFAGPGGLGEGFCRVHSDSARKAFQVKLSIERHPIARETLKLRSFLRKFDDEIPRQYYDLVESSGVDLNSRLRTLYETYPNQASEADAEAWLAELGKVETRKVRERIDHAINNKDCWVLIGGPPCQAYSLAGRSRNSGKPGYLPEKDERQYLYLEYLQILADHRPAIFVMENVKGLLSATLRSQRIFERILEDLSRPSEALRRIGRRVEGQRTNSNERYRLFSLVQPPHLTGPSVADFVVRMEQYGIPQTRHRIIVFGVREDLAVTSVPLLRRMEPVTLRSALSDLPRIRSRLSRQEDSIEAWTRLIEDAKDRRWYYSAANQAGDKLLHCLDATVSAVCRNAFNTGGEFLPVSAKPSYRRDWFVDDRLRGIVHHRSKAHMTKDIYRYLFAACFATALGRTPTLRDFPADLLPKHKNIKKALDAGHFDDRFRVQLWDHPATTITSHISKDGHYFIHPDPQQCRALTAREAARLQTFPDNYFFCGARTAQYVQIGNAVPPMLAFDIGTIVLRTLKSAGAA